MIPDTFFVQNAAIQVNTTLCKFFLQYAVMSISLHFIWTGYYSNWTGPKSFER